MTKNLSIVASCLLAMACSDAAPTGYDAGNKSLDDGAGTGGSSQGSGEQTPRASTGAAPGSGGESSCTGAECKKEDDDVCVVAIDADSDGTLFVSPRGDDSAAGTKDRPLATLAKAAEVAMAGDVVVIAGGTYQEALEPQNSGREDAPITFRGAAGEKVIISAMQALADWQQDEGDVYKTSVSWDLGEDNMVLHGSTLMDLARWPNNESGSPFPLSVNLISGGGRDYLEYAPGIPDWNWANGGTLHFYGGAGFLAWKDAITSSTKTRVNFNFQRSLSWIQDKHHPGYTGHGKHLGEFFLQGIREALDYKNEWFFDAVQEQLYVQIEGGEKPLDGAIMMRKRTMGIELSQDYIHVENLAVFGGTIEMTGDYNSLLKVSSFYGNNTLGVIDGFDSKRQSVLVVGRGNTIEQCEIAYGAGNGVRDRGDETLLQNSYVHDFDFLGQYDAVLNTRDADGSRYIANTLTRGGRDIIQAYVNGGEYAYNDISFSNIVADDCGLLYTTNVRSKKSSIHHNWFHDAYAKNGRHKAAGIYLDNDSANWDVYRNLVWNTDWTNVQINWNGTNLDIFNNTLVKGSATMGAWHKEGTSFSDVRVWNNLTDEYASDNGNSQEDEGTWEPQSERQNNVVSNSTFIDFEGNDFHLKSGGDAVDAGRSIDGITDAHRGSAPDAGAFEEGDSWTAGIDWDINAGPTGCGCYGLPGEACSN